MIRLAPALTFPAAELATEVVASLGQRGGGKSNGAAVIAEGLLDAGIQVIVLDHVGIWFSLRLDESGKHASPYTIPVLGGQHGDIALVATTGATVAEALAQSGSSAVLDVSDFGKMERCRFAADFAEAFFRVKKLHPGPVQILLEEAQRYVPQKLFAGQGLERMLGAFEEIAEVGRNYGIGLHLISQRPQKINKDVLNLADTVLAYRSNGVLERKAIGEWVQEKGAEGRKEVHDELPGLPRGSAIVWSPNRECYGQFAIKKKSTYDAGATPIHARAAVKTKRLDLAALETAMGRAVEEAKANDPRVLRAKIAELEKKLAGAVRGASISTGADTGGSAATRAERSERTKQIARIEKLADKLDKQEKKFVHDFEQGAAAVRMLIAGFDKTRDKLVDAQLKVAGEILNLKTMIGAASSVSLAGADRSTGRSAGAVEAIRGNGVGRRFDDSVLNNVPDTGISYRDPGRGERQARVIGAEARPSSMTGADSAGTEPMPEKCQRMLGALRQGEAMGLSSMPFHNVAVIAGVAPTSGTTSNRRSFLKGNGYIEVIGDHVRLTDKGRAYPINVALPPDDPQELLRFWQREIGTEKIAKMLEVIVTRGREGEALTSAELAAAVGMEESGTFSNYRGALASRGLIVKQGAGVYGPASVFLR